MKNIIIHYTNWKRITKEKTWKKYDDINYTGDGIYKRKNGML